MHFGILNCEYSLFLVLRHLDLLHFIISFVLESNKYDVQYILTISCVEN